jgi:hypothetical protein
MGGIKTDSGEHVRQQHRIPAAQVRYHWDGSFFMPLEKFPGALADRSGYVIFATSEEYSRNRHLDHRGSPKNPRLGVRGGISRMPSYVNFPKSNQ